MSSKIEKDIDSKVHDNIAKCSKVFIQEQIRILQMNG